jgi:hypothetical protein
MMTYQGRKFSPADFESKEFLKAITPSIEQYAQWRAKGFPKSVSFTKAFGNAYNDFYLNARIEALELIRGYRAFEQGVKDRMSISELWNEGEAREFLGEMARNPFNSKGARDAAARALTKMGTQ